MPRAKLPPHIIQPRQTCFARVSVPRDIQAIVGRREFKASTGLTDPHKAYVKAVPWIAEWKARIEHARATTADPLRARIEQLTNAYRQYRNTALDDAGASLVMDALEFAFEREGGQLTVALARERDAVLALSSPAIVNQIAGKATTFLAHLKQWKENTHIKGDTLKTYEADIRQFADAVKQPVETLDRHHVKTWTDDLAKTLTAETVRRKLIAVRCYWTWLDEKGLTPKNSAPFAGHRIRDRRSGAERAEDKRQRFPIATVPKLWQAAEAEDDAILATLIRWGAYTGARIESICRLRVADVRRDPDTNHRFIHFKDKTEAGVRDVPLHSAIEDEVDETVAKAGKDGYLLPLGAAKRRSGNVGKRFTDLKRRVGFDDPRLVFHSIRKTITHMLEMAECPEGVAQDLIGHVKPGLTYGTYSGMTRLDHRRRWLEKAVVYPTARS
jgi:integrase